VLPVLFMTGGMFGAVVLHAYVFLSPFGQQLETSQTDLWFRVRGVRAPPSDLIIGALDEATYRELGLSQLQPLPRGLIGELIGKLHEAGAEMCFLDFIFRDPGTSLVDNEKLAAALRAFPTIIGAFDYMERDNIAKTAALVEVFPRVEFSSAAAIVAKVNVIEVDSVRYFTQTKAKEREVIPLPYSYARWAKLSRVPAFQDLINYYGPPGTIPAVSIHKVLRNDRAANEALFKGKLVAVGNTLATGLSYSIKDSFMTPASSRPMAGVEIHATVLGNVRTGEWIHRTPLSRELVILSAVLVVVSGVFFTLSAGPALVFYSLITAGWSVWAYLWFLNDKFLPGVLAFYGVLPLVLVVAILGKHRTLKGRLKHIGSMLGMTDRLDE
jgi:CHASE2 domain-containing sensor protein